MTPYEIKTKEVRVCGKPTLYPDNALAQALVDFKKGKAFTEKELTTFRRLGFALILTDLNGKVERFEPL